MIYLLNLPPTLALTSKNSKHLLNTYYVPSMVLRVLLILSHFIFKTTIKVLAIISIFQMNR